MKRTVSMVLAWTIGLYALAQTSKPANEAIQKGNSLYRQEQYQQAEAAYAEALEKQSSNITAKFNRANTLVRQAKSTEAIKAYENIIMDATTATLKADSYYNKGVILSGQRKLEESIEAYKNALRQNPADQQARENLQKALLELKKKKPTPQKQDKQQQKQQQQPQPRMSQKEAQQRLKLLEQKEKELQQRMQKSKSQGGGQTKDW